MVGWALNDTATFRIFQTVMLFGGLFMILGAPTAYALKKIYNKFSHSGIKESKT